MENSKIKGEKSLILYFIAAFSIVFIVSYTVLFFVQKEVVRIRVEETKSNELRLLQMENDMLGKEFRMIMSDLFYLLEAYEDMLAGPEDYEYVSENWKVFSEKKGIYDQIRFIDAKGNEQVRINYTNTHSYIVPVDDLQNKKDRYYFYETLALEENMVFVSPIDLNIENGSVEIPYKPMIRFSTPVYDDSGTFRGAIVLNYLADNLLEEFKALAENSFGELVFLNSESYWISSRDSSLEWNFMFDDKADVKFASVYEYEWNKIVSDEEQFHTKNGLYTDKTIDLSEKLNLNTGYINPEIILGDGYWYIVSRVDQEDIPEIGFLTKERILLFDIFTSNKYYFIFMTLVSISIGILIYINRRAYYKIKYFSEYDSLTQIYNRRAGIDKLNSIAISGNRRNPQISLCYIDINGLKEVNDKLGHKSGDELIKTSVSIIKNEIRKDDFAMRLGGDEFMIVLNGVDEENAENIWRRIRKACDAVNTEEDRPYLVSLSHGIVDFTYDGNNEIDNLIKIADERMYAEKKLIKKNINIIKANSDEG